MSGGRFCPQCGDRVHNAVDAEGFCSRSEKGRMYACAEHLRRFDAETGERVGTPRLSHSSAWAQTGTDVERAPVKWHPTRLIRVSE